MCRLMPGALGCVQIPLFFAALVLGGGASAGELVITLPSGAGVGEFQAALAAARRHRAEQPGDAILIQLPRTMQLRAPLRLTAADSGTAEAPLVLRGAADGGTTISGGVPLDSAPMDQAEDDSAIPEAVRSKVRVANLGSLQQVIGPGIVATSSFDRAQVKRLVVFFGNQRLQQARWPAQGYVRHADIVEGAGAEAGRPVRLRLPPDAPEGMARERNLWIGGYWRFNWWYEFHAVSVGDNRTVRFPAPSIGISPQEPRYFFANVASALSRPNTYYFDRQSGRIFFFEPPENERMSRNATVAVAENLIRITDASSIRIENVAFEQASGSAVILQRADHITLRDCFVGHTGGGGIVIDGGMDNTIERCVIADVGETGVAIDAGDRKSLTPANDVVRDCVITRFGVEMPTYRPGVGLEGVGNAVEGSEIYEGTHSAIIAHGNDHRIVGNVVHDVVEDSDDAGAIYLGRWWTMRGSVVASNEIYNVRNKVGSLDVVGVYLDDQLSGTQVRGNAFHDVDLPVLLGGGRDNAISNNVFFGAAEQAISMDARGLSWQKDLAQHDLREDLAAFHVDKPPWSLHYPQLGAILADQPGAPLGNLISGNVAVDTKLMGYKEPGTAAYPRLEGNRETQGRLDASPSTLLDEADRLSGGGEVLQRTRSLVKQTWQNASILESRWQSLLR
jgi:hypothetical protein